MLLGYLTFFNRNAEFISQKSHIFTLTIALASLVVHLHFILFGTCLAGLHQWPERPFSLRLRFADTTDRARRQGQVRSDHLAAN